MDQLATHDRNADQAAYWNGPGGRHWTDRQETRGAMLAPVSEVLFGGSESAVVGLPHPDLGEGVTAVVVTAPGALLSEPAALAALQDRLARYKLPKRVFFVEALPRNAMGKVQKNALRDELKGLYDG